MSEFGLYILLLAAIVFSVVAQIRVKTTFSKYSKISGRRGLTGAETAKVLLERNGITGVAVERVHGRLTDHYDPRAKVLRLSDGVYESRSLAALGVAAHETGHAIQHAHGFAPLAVRGALFPAVSFGSKLAMPLIFIGFLLSAVSRSMGEIGSYVIYAGVIMYAAVVVFQVVTLPVEFDASRRALAELQSGGILDPDETRPARKVLGAAAMTYLAAAAVAILQLLRFILMANRRR